MIVVSGGTFRNRWILGESEFCLKNVLIRESSKIEGVGLFHSEHTLHVIN